MRIKAFRLVRICGVILVGTSCGGSEQRSTQSTALTDAPPLTAIAAAGVGSTDPAATASIGGAGGPDRSALSCIEQYPAPTPFDVGDAPRPSTPPEPGMPSAPGPVPTLEPIVEECVTGGGSNCDAKALVSKEAALCIAQARPHEGFDSWSAEFRFQAAYPGGRLEWFVFGAGERAPDGCTLGLVIEIDVTSGSVLSAITGRFCTVE